MSMHMSMHMSRHTPIHMIALISMYMPMHMGILMYMVCSFTWRAQTMECARVHARVYAYDCTHV